MASIHSASIYKFSKKNKYLIYGSSRLQMGASIASEPFIWINSDVITTNIVKQLLLALSKNQINVPNPSNWDEFTKGFLKNLGLKKPSDLYTDSILVGVSYENGLLFFEPTKNMGRQGFLNLSKKKTIEIIDTKSFEEISNALKNAFEMCE